MKNFIKKKIENLISIHRNNTIINLLPDVNRLEAIWYCNRRILYANPFFFSFFSIQTKKFMAYIYFLTIFSQLYRQLSAFLRNIFFRFNFAIRFLEISVRHELCITKMFWKKYDRVPEKVLSRIAGRIFG